MFLRFAFPLMAAVASGRRECVSERSDSKPFGVPHGDCQNLVLNCNKDGMDFLRTGKFKQAFEQLKYAEAMLVAEQPEEPTSLFAMTCNNLGCYYKKVGKLHAALSYLRKALKIEVSLQTDDVTVAGTHLNICAIMSKLDKHDKAVQHAQCALDLVRGNRNLSQDDTSVLAIAYHNVAVEHDFLHQWDLAAVAYREGQEVAKKCLGVRHPLTQTLAKNSEEAAQKAKKHTRPPRQTGLSPSSRHLPPTSAHGAPINLSHSPSLPAAPGVESPSALPELPIRARSKEPQSAAQPMPMTGYSIHQEAAEWVQQSEAGAWRISSNSLPALRSSHHGQTQLDKISPAGTAASPVPRLPSGLQGCGSAHLPTDPPSQQHDASPSVGSLGSRAGFNSRRETGDAWPPIILDEPEAVPVAAAPPPSPPPLIVMGEVAAARGRSAVPADSFGRPKGPPDLSSSRGPPLTARERRIAARAQNTFNVHAGKDEEPKDMRKTHEKQSQLLRRVAAERLQKAWRAHQKYFKTNRDRIVNENRCATMIQARWRAYHVRKTKLDKAATVIQKYARRWLVLHHCRVRRAATVIQKHYVGTLVRRRLKRQNEAATELQRVTRGVLGRRRAIMRKVQFSRTALLLQRCIRGMLDRRIARQKREERRKYDEEVSSATVIQAFMRGRKGRHEAWQQKKRIMQSRRRCHSAVRIQSAWRRHQAEILAGEFRVRRLRVMHAAATAIRKIWLGKIHRAWYLELRSEFKAHEASVVVIQRYMRGFLVRVRMWRDALRSEEELWAAVEIQRVWRGYVGRLRWEMAYEAVWTRQTAADRLQRYVRGWLARTRVHRMRKRIARADFERARQRFKAAQKIQSRWRGHVARNSIADERRRIHRAAVAIQRITRGHQLRARFWAKVKQHRAIQIQSLARGWLVRARRVAVVAKVIMIQRRYRRWRMFVQSVERGRRCDHWRERRSGYVLAAQ